MNSSRSGFIILSLLSISALLSLLLLMVWNRVALERKLFFHYQKALERSIFIESIFEYANKRLLENIDHIKKNVQVSPEQTYDLSSLGAHLNYPFCSRLQMQIRKSTIPEFSSGLFIQVMLHFENEKQEMRWYLVPEKKGVEHAYCNYYTLSNCSK